MRQNNLKNSVKTYTHEGVKKIQFVNKANNTTQTYDVEYVLDVINQIKG